MAKFGSSHYVTLSKIALLGLESFSWRLPYLLEYFLGSKIGGSDSNDRNWQSSKPEEWHWWLKLSSNKVLAMFRHWVWGRLYDNIQMCTVGMYFVRYFSTIHIVGVVGYTQVQVTSDKMRYFDTALPLTFLEWCAELPVAGCMRLSLRM